MVVRQPLVLTDRLNAFDIMVNVSGGGESGQAGAVRHGIARALIEFDAALKTGAAAIVIEGKLVDYAMYQRAKRVLAVAALDK